MCMAIQNVCWIYSSGAGPGTLFGPLASLDDYRRHLRNGGGFADGPRSLLYTLGRLR